MSEAIVALDFSLQFKGHVPVGASKAQSAQKGSRSTNDGERMLLGVQLVGLPEYVCIPSHNQAH